MIWIFIAGLFLEVINPSTSEKRAHDYHISHLEIVEKSSSYQAILHLFIDDLELALDQKGYSKLRIGLDGESPLVDSLILAYLEETVTFDQGDFPSTWEWIGKENGEDPMSLLCYIEFPKIANQKSLIIQNKLLTDIYDDQKNIVQIKFMNRKDEYLLFHYSSRPNVIIL